MQKPAVLMTLTYLTLSVVPLCCLSRQYKTHYSPHLKCLLKVSTLHLVRTRGLYYALRTSQHKPHSPIISPVQHSCYYTSSRKVSQLRFV
jgi:hypothetical protein